MNLSLEGILNIIATVISMLLFIFAIDWRYFRDWVVVFLFNGLVDFIFGSPIVTLNLIKYPIRLLPDYYQTSLLFELWVFPVLCILYNQVTRERGFWAIIYYALLFSAGITGIEYPIELYTDLIKYIEWSWLTSFYTLTATLLISRSFIGCYRWGCDYFSHK